MKIKSYESIGMAPFCCVVRQVMCLRRCASLIRIAEKTGCRIQIASGGQEGSTESILSLLRMELQPGTVVVLFICGNRKMDAFHESLSLLRGNFKDWM